MLTKQCKGSDGIMPEPGRVEQPEVEGAMRPLALGYIREDRWMSNEQLTHAKRVLAEFADREGYSLGTIYVDHLERTPAAFEALVATAIREEAAAVIVPGFDNLALIGSAPELAAHLAKRTGARILDAGDQPGRTASAR